MSVDNANFILLHSHILWKLICSCLLDLFLYSSTNKTLAEQWVSCKKQKLLTLRENLGLPRGFSGGLYVAHALVFCVVFFVLFAFVLCIVMLPVSLDCPFWISPSVFSNVFVCILSDK